MRQAAEQSIRERRLQTSIGIAVTAIIALALLGIGAATHPSHHSNQPSGESSYASLQHIGVSNFLPGHIELITRATGVAPAVNQIELHPYFQQRAQRAYDDAHGIITEAWSPLGRANTMLKDRTISAIAEKHGISPVQAILRWHLQIGDVAIPKSTNEGRQRANLDLGGFALDRQDMDAIADLDNKQGRGFGQDPRWHEEA